HPAKRAGTEWRFDKPAAQQWVDQLGNCVTPFSHCLYLQVEVRLNSRREAFVLRSVLYFYQGAGSGRAAQGTGPLFRHVSRRHLFPGTSLLWLAHASTHVQAAGGRTRGHVYTFR
ncbi:unnamed protein product, partial [Pylaiella littoralis]